VLPSPAGRCAVTSGGDVVFFNRHRLHRWRWTLHQLETRSLAHLVGDASPVDGARVLAASPDGTRWSIADFSAATSAGRPATPADHQASRSSLGSVGGSAHVAGVELSFRSDVRVNFQTETKVVDGEVRPGGGGGSHGRVLGLRAKGAEAGARGVAAQQLSCEVCLVQEHAGDELFLSVLDLTYSPAAAADGGANAGAVTTLCSVALPVRRRPAEAEAEAEAPLGVVELGWISRRQIGVCCPDSLFIYRVDGERPVVQLTPHFQISPPALHGPAATMFTAMCNAAGGSGVFACVHDPLHADSTIVRYDLAGDLLSDAQLPRPPAPRRRAGAAEGPSRHTRSKHEGLKLVLPSPPFLAIHRAGEKLYVGQSGQLVVFDLEAWAWRKRKGCLPTPPAHALHQAPAQGEAAATGRTALACSSGALEPPLEALGLDNAVVDSACPILQLSVFQEAQGVRAPRQPRAGETEDATIAIVRRSDGTLLALRIDEERVAKYILGHPDGVRRIGACLDPSDERHDGKKGSASIVTVSPSFVIRHGRDHEGSTSGSSVHDVYAEMAGVHEGVSFALAPNAEQLSMSCWTVNEAATHAAGVLEGGILLVWDLTGKESGTLTHSADLGGVLGGPDRRVDGRTVVHLALPQSGAALLCVSLNDGAAYVLAEAQGYMGGWQASPAWRGPNVSDQFESLPLGLVLTRPGTGSSYHVVTSCSRGKVGIERRAVPPPSSGKWDKARVTTLPGDGLGYKGVGGQFGGLIALSSHPSQSLLLTLTKGGLVIIYHTWLREARGIIALGLDGWMAGLRDCMSLRVDPTGMFAAVASRDTSRGRRCVEVVQLGNGVSFPLAVDGELVWGGMSDLVFAEIHGSLCLALAFDDGSVDVQKLPPTMNAVFERAQKLQAIYSLDFWERYPIVHEHFRKK